MPTVPTYSSPQEQLAPMPGVRQESVASPGMFDAGAEQQMALGKSEMEAGTGLAQIAYHMQQRQTADALFQATASDKTAFLQYQQDVQKNRQGSGAQGVTSDTAAWWKQRINDNLDNLQGDDLKRLYTRQATDMQLQSLHSMSQFETQQTDEGQMQNYKADKANTVNMVTANPNGQMVSWGVDDIHKKNAYMAATKNWTPEVLEAVNSDDITNLHKQVIQQLAVTNKDQAQAYFEAHKDEIAGSQRAEIGDFAEKATAASIGAQAAQTVWQAQGPQGDKDPVNIDQMTAAIRDQMKDNMFARDAAITELHQLRADHLEGVQSRDQALTASVNTMLLGGQSLAAIQQTPQWAALDGTEQLKIKESQANYLNAQDSHAIAAQTRQQEQLKLSGADAMFRLSNPELLTSMTRDQVTNLLPQIGISNTQTLLSKYDTLTKNGAALSEAKIDNNQFNNFIKTAGLDPLSADHGTKQQINDTRNNIEQIIGQEQIAKKRQLTRDEKDMIMRQAIDNQVLTTHWYGDSSAPAITMPADTTASVKGQTVRFGDVPEAFQQQAIAARKAQGFTTTPEQLGELWLRHNGKLK